jgi:hypothetical protein
VLPCGGRGGAGISGGTWRTALRLGRAVVAPVARCERRQDASRASTTMDQPRDKGKTSASSDGPARGSIRRGAGPTAARHARHTERNAASPVTSSRVLLPMGSRRSVGRLDQSGWCSSSAIVDRSCYRWIYDGGQALSIYSLRLFFFFFVVVEFDRVLWSTFDLVRHVALFRTRPGLVSPAKQS